MQALCEDNSLWHHVYNEKHRVSYPFDMTKNWKQFYKEAYGKLDEIDSDILKDVISFLLYNIESLTIQLFITIDALSILKSDISKLL